MGLNRGTRTQNAIRNIMAAFGGKIIAMCCNFICRMLFIQYLGIELLGINELFANTLVFLSIAELGIGIAINVNLYKPIANNDENKIAAMMNFFRNVYRGVAILVACIGLLFLPFLPHIIHLDKEIPNLYLYYCLFVIKSSISYLCAYKTALIIADQKARISNCIEMGIAIIKLIAQILIIVIIADYLLFVLVELIAIIAQNFVISILVDKMYPFVNNSSLLNAEDRKRIIADIKSVFLYKISFAFLNGTDSIIISAVVSTVMVGVYSNYNLVINGLNSFIVLFFTAITASIGNYIVTQNNNERYKLFQRVQLVSAWLAIIMVVCGYNTIHDFIMLWIGDKYILPSLTIAVIFANTFYSIYMRAIWSFRDGTGLYRRICYMMLITAAINVLLSIILGMEYGVTGVVLASLLSKILTCFWYEPIVLFRDYFSRGSTEYFIMFMRISIYTLIGSVFIALISQNLVINSWLKLVVKFVISFALVNIYCYIIFRHNTGFYYVKSMVTNLINKKICLFKI